MPDLESVKERAKKMLGGMYLKNAGLNDVQIANLEMMGYFSAPASKGHHLARKGGLFEHSTNVTHWLTKLTEDWNIEWPRPESPFLVGMLHDLVKCKCYHPVVDEEGHGREEFEYVQPIWPGHGVASNVIATSELSLSLYPAESAAIIYHMGALCLGKDQLKEYDAALGEYPLQIIATYTADMLASRVDEEFDETAPDGSGEMK